MSRATNTAASRRRRKKILKEAGGYRGGQSKLFRTAAERVARALQYAYRDRRVKKRDFRSLWITRIGIASKLQGLSYSRLIAGLKKANIAVDRKVLADLAVRAPQAFADVVAKAKASLA
ncbi:MAG: 50S ribosomal protein L20 [Deltaproteobacteria bacterium]|nr:50S ribosomal protein L20 [Deltaproteobacteria bacterium]